MPKISIIIPVYNSVSMLEKALLSAIEQEGVDKEIVVMDGGSTDGTVDVIKQHAASITYWASERDDGPNDAYNKGIAKATGEIIGLLNADDWLEPGILRKVSDAFAEDPTLDAVTFEACLHTIAENGELITTKHFNGKSLELKPTGTPMPNARYYTKKLYQRAGPFLVSNHRNERMIAVDLEMLLRLCTMQVKHKILPVIGYHYLSHSGSITFSNDERNMKKMYDERAHIAETYLATPLAEHYSARLKRWHRRGTLRMYIWYLREGKKELANAEKIRGIRVSPIAWRVDYWRMKLSGKAT